MSERAIHEQSMTTCCGKHIVASHDERDSACRAVGESTATSQSMQTTLPQASQTGWLLTSMSILRKTAFASTIRPPREFLRQTPGRMVMLLFRRGSRNLSRVAVTAAVEKSTARRSRTSCEDSSRLLGIMAFEPLRDAFGDFCHKSLCGEVRP